MTMPTGLFGDPVTTGVAATGAIAFAANPSPGDTITLNGTVWTFVTGPASTNETEIRATFEDTLNQLVSDINASADPEITTCTYAHSVGEPKAVRTGFPVAVPENSVRF